MKAFPAQLKGKRALLIGGGTLTVILLCLLIRKGPDALEVPLGVEQAAIVTFSGPDLAVAPYKWGVAVNVRIAQVTRQPGRQVYDVRYFVNRAGTFDLKDYLVAVDGSALAALPSFKFRGSAKLAKQLDTRIRETEDLRIDPGGHYDQVLALLAVLWIGWLLLLLFYRRSGPAAPSEPAPADPTPAERLRGILAQLESGTLDTAGKARMEMLLLRCWRNQLALDRAPMRLALGAIRSHERTAAHLQTLQHWLHHPASAIPRTEIAAILEPLAADPSPGLPAAP